MSIDTGTFNWADEVEEQLFRNENNAHQVNNVNDSNRERAVQYRFYKPGTTRPSPIFNVHSEDARYVYLNPESLFAEEPANMIAEHGTGTDGQVPEWRRDAHGQGLSPTWNNPNTGPNKKKKKGKQRRQDNYNSSQKIRSPDDYYEAQAMDDPSECMLPTADRILEPVKAPEVPEELDLWAADKKKKSQPYL